MTFAPQRSPGSRQRGGPFGRRAAGLRRRDLRRRRHLPYPIYAKWAEAYQKTSGVQLNYQAIGSGGGIKQIKARTVTFGASDMPLKQDELKKDGLVQWPMVMGGIVPVVNLEGVQPGQLVLDGPTLAKIFLGEIKTWDDPAIKPSSTPASSCRRPASPSCIARTARAPPSTSPTTSPRSRPTGRARSARPPR